VKLKSSCFQVYAFKMYYFKLKASKSEMYVSKKSNIPIKQPSKVLRPLAQTPSALAAIDDDLIDNALFQLEMHEYAIIKLLNY